MSDDQDIPSQVLEELAQENVTIGAKLPENPKRSLKRSLPGVLEKIQKYPRLVASSTYIRDEVVNHRSTIGAGDQAKS